MGLVCRLMDREKNTSEETSPTKQGNGLIGANGSTTLNVGARTQQRQLAEIRMSTQGQISKPPGKARPEWFRHGGFRFGRALAGVPVNDIMPEVETGARGWGGTLLARAWACHYRVVGLLPLPRKESKPSTFG